MFDTFARTTFEDGEHEQEEKEKERKHKINTHTCCTATATHARSGLRLLAAVVPDLEAADKRESIVAEGE
jgi:hypothetical protein